MIKDTPDEMAPPNGSSDTEPPPTLEIVVDAVVERGVIRPRVPLALPEGTPIQLRIAARLTATVSAAPATAAELPPAPPPAPPPARLRRPRRAAILDRLGSAIGAIPSGARPALASFGAALAMLAQLDFHRGLTFTWAGLCYALAGMLLFSLAMGGPAPSDAPPPEAPPAPAPPALAPAIFSSPWRLTLLFGVVIGTIGLLQALRAQPPMPSYQWALPAWLGLIAVYAVAVLPTPWRLPGLDPRRLARPLPLAALAIFLAALALRAWDLAGYPATLSGDEGRFGVEAMKVLRGEINHPFTTGWLSVPTMTFFFNAPTVALLGNTMEGLRLPWAIMGALNVLAVFWLATRLQGPAVGIVTAALLAVYHYHIHYARLGLNNIADPFFTTLTLLLLYRAYDRRSVVDWLLCGATLGIGQYFYFGARFIVIVAVATLGLLIIRDGRRFWPAHGRGLLVGLGAALVASGPIIQFAILHPDMYNARVNQTGIIQSGWLVNEVVVRNQPMWQILLDQFQRAILAYNAYPDRTIWYAITQPLFGVLMGAGLLLGIGYVALRLFDPRLSPMLFWWGAGLILGGMLTESPPSSQRLITTAVPAVFLVAVALVRGTTLLGSAMLPQPWSRPIRAIVMAAVVAAFAFFSLRLYFIEYSPQRIYGSLNGVVSTSVGYYAREQLGPEWRIYFLGPPRMSFGFGSNLYLAPEVDGRDVDVSPNGAEGLRATETDKHVAYVVLPERAGDLALISELYPGHTVETIPSPIDDGPLYYVYRVPRDQL